MNQLLNKTQQLGLKYLEEFEEKIPRDEMKEMEVGSIDWIISFSFSLRQLFFEISKPLIIN